MRFSQPTATIKNLAQSKPELSEWSKSVSWLVPACALLALAGFATTLLWVRRAKPSGLDLTTTTRFQTLRNPLLYLLMEGVSSLGYTPEIHLLILAAAGYLWLMKRRIESLFTLLSVGAPALVVLVKTLVNRPRPAGNKIRVAVRLLDSAFPSGHTVHYVSFYGFLAYLAATLVKAAWLRQALLAFFAFLIAFIGPSRIYLGEHWLSDVVAAYLFGFAYLIGLIEAYQRVKARMSHSRSKRSLR